MSIFSSLFAKEPEIELASVPEPAAEPGRQPESAPTGELFEGMRVNVMTKEGDPLLSGKITGLTSDTLTLGRLPGELSFKTATIGTTVSLSGYDKKLIPICLSATVQESGRTVFKVKNLKVESHSESRDTFRLPFNAPYPCTGKTTSTCATPSTAPWSTSAPAAAASSPSTSTWRMRCCASGSSWRTTPR